MFDISDGLENEIIKWRRDLHKIPETGLLLPMTREYVCNILDDIGVDYDYSFNDDSSIIVTIKNGTGKRCIALRADMDALPVKEELDLEFKSENENMHACGHDGHTACMLGVIKTLYEQRELIDGEVRILLQASEELCEGAKALIEAHALDGVDYIFGMHAGCISDEPGDGQIAVKSGPIMGSNDCFNIKIYSDKSDDIIPTTDVNLNEVACNIVTALQFIVSRELSPQDFGVISSCDCKTREDLYEITGSIRTYDLNVRELIKKRIREVADGVARADRARAETVYLTGTPPLVNEEMATDMVIKAAAEALGEENLCIMKKPAMPAEDFAYYLLEKPGAFFFTMNPLYVDGVCYPHHHPKFGLNEEHFMKPVKVFLQLVWNYVGGANDERK